MSVSDASFAELTETVSRMLARAEETAGVELTAAARQIAVTFVVGIVVEGPPGRLAEQISPEEYTGRLIGEAESTFVTALRLVPRQEVSGPSGRAWVTTIDVWHWLASGQARDFSLLPYEK
jgi:hypothetical protein